MKFRTKQNEFYVTSTGEVVDHHSDAPEEAVFLVTPPTPKESIKIIDKSTKKVWERGQRFENTDFYKAKLKRITATIKAWWQVEDEDGEALECNTHNREIVYLYNSDVIDRVLDVAGELGKDKEEDNKDEEKNS